MKRSRLKALFIGLATLLLVAGVVALPVVRAVRQEAKDRALIAAIRRNDDFAVVRLLEAGANANAEDMPKDKRPFWRAGWDILWRHQMRKNGVYTALLVAIQTRIQSPYNAVSTHLFQGQIMRSLLEHGAKVTAISEDRPCSLLPLVAASIDDPDVLQAMINKGADVDATLMGTSLTALIWAAGTRHVADVQCLLNAHANLAIKDMRGNTALWYAMHPFDGGPPNLESKHIVRLLRQAGAR